jgi:hypothetical protein
MSRYQLTIRTPNGKRWRIRPVSGEEFREISREILLQASDRIKNLDLLSLWPDKTIDRWKKFAADGFDSLIRSVGHAIETGDHKILRSGRGLLASVSEWMKSFGWKELEWSLIAKRLVKIVISLGLAYLRTQFPVIDSRNSVAALDVMESLLLQRA